MPSPVLFGDSLQPAQPFRPGEAKLVDQGMWHPNLGGQWRMTGLLRESRELGNQTTSVVRNADGGQLGAEGHHGPA